MICDECFSDNHDQCEQGLCSCPNCNHGQFRRPTPRSGREE